MNLITGHVRTVLTTIKKPLLNFVTLYQLTNFTNNNMKEALI